MLRLDVLLDRHSRSLKLSIVHLPGNARAGTDRPTADCRSHPREGPEPPQSDVTASRRRWSTRTYPETGRAVSIGPFCWVCAGTHSAIAAASFVLRRIPENQKEIGRKLIPVKLSAALIKKWMYFSWFSSPSYQNLKSAPIRCRQSGENLFDFARIPEHTERIALLVRSENMPQTL